MKRKTILNLSLIIFAILFVTLGIYLLVPSFLADEVYPLKYEDYIRKYSKEYGVDPALVAAVILQESRFNPNAVSSMGAKGLMQFMPATAATMAKEVGRKSYDIFDPETSIQFGAAHIRDMLIKYNNNIDAALAAYNAGSGNADSWIRRGILGNIPFRETNNYVKKVKNYQTVYASMYWKDLGIENPIKLESSSKIEEKNKVAGFVWSQIFTNFINVISKD